MALVISCAILLAVVLFAGIAAIFGHRLLKFINLELPNEGEHLLCSIALGVICLEVLLFLVQLSAHIKEGIITVVVVAFLTGATQARLVIRKASHVLRAIFPSSLLTKALFGVTAAVLVFEGFAAMAPLTGSDALHYHFTAPLLILQSGFHPNLFLSHSFLTGQSHLLILAGLSLGSSQLAMGLIFLGGALAAAAGASLACCLTARSWPRVLALLFLLTPVVFWQICSAGAPDLWMAFFSTLGVVVIARSKEFPNSAPAILAGALAGAVAGSKYTGCIVAASMALAYFWEARSLGRSALFLFSSLGAGIWPYARNWVWTGDPMFPFLTRWLSPGTVNAHTLASYLADTGAGTHQSVWQILRFPLFAGIDLAHLGFWQFFGPLVLAFSPFLFFAVRKTPAWRATLTVWALSALGIGFSSGMTRFLLPIFPIALAAVLAGVAQVASAERKLARAVSIATVSGFILFGAGSLLLYARPAFAAATGFISKENYLRDHAPEYEKVQFVNQVLGAKQGEGKTVVFGRHLFYLRVPFLYCDPAASWAIDPAKFQASGEWLAFFRQQNVNWVVRSSNYPPPIAAPLMQLEAQGKLVPVALAEVSDFRGFRIAGERQNTSVVVLQVAR